MIDRIVAMKRWACELNPKVIRTGHAPIIRISEEELRNQVRAAALIERGGALVKGES